jgi:D-serine deaminase-like pyridoxal phosphate-dependent protein
MVFRTSGKKYEVGDVLYGVPHHVCPTIALHDQVCIIEKQQVTDYWDTISRNRKITI